MNLAHETDLLLWEETTVIDETGATFCVVFPLLIIERFDPEALAFSASIDRTPQSRRYRWSRLFFYSAKTTT